MKAAVCYEKNKPAVIDDLRLDPPGPNEVRVRMVACGVCHSDLSVVDGTLKMRLPCVIGHEGAGIVEEVGAGVTHLREGDKVVLAWVTPCGQCFYCRKGRPNLCEVGEQINKTNRMPDGSTRLHKGDVDYNVFSAIGALAEYATVPARAAVRLDADAPLEKAAVIGCAVTTGVGAVWNTAQVEPGSSVAVFGAGGVGLNVIQGAVIAGAERIIAVDLHPKKLELAKAFGATDVIDAKDADVLGALRALTSGRGPDYAFECIGRKTTIEQAYASVRKGGTCVVVGLGSVADAISLNVFVLPVFEKRLLGCWYGTADVHRDFPKLLQLYRDKKLKLDELVSRTYRLEQISEAFEDMRAGVNARGVVVF